MNTNLLSNGIELMLLGMGTVFVFLTLLVFVTTCMSFLVQKYFPEPAIEIDSSETGSQTLGQNTLLAIISAAIHEHRTKNK